MASALDLVASITVSWHLSASAFDLYHFFMPDTMSLARTGSVTMAWTLTWTRVYNGVEAGGFVYTVSIINNE